MRRPPRARGRIDGWLSDDAARDYVLRFVPALDIGDDEVADGLARLRAALEAFVASG